MWRGMFNYASELLACVHGYLLVSTYKLTLYGLQEFCENIFRAYVRCIGGATTAKEVDGTKD